MGMFPNRDGSSSMMITVDKTKLLESLKSNREKHEKQFKAAHAAFLKEQLRLLKIAYQQARKGKKPNIRAAYSLSEPTCHLDEYDKTIRMLEYGKAEEIVLTDSEFSKFVDDEWGWKAAFTQVAMSYAGG